MRKYVASVLLCFIAFYTNAQSNKLTSVIKQVEREYQVTFSYDADLIKNHKCSFDLSGKSVESIIRELSDLTGFDLELVDSKHVILKRGSKKPAPRCIEVQEFESKEIISGITAYIVGQESNGAISDVNGKICLTQHVYESDLLVVQGYGYKKTFVPVKDILNGKTIISLEIEDIIADDIKLNIFLTSGIKITPQSHGIEINTDDLALLPGETAGDILESIQILPGITSGNGKSGNIQVRGSTTDQTLILMDDIPIYHKGHFYGTLSPFNPDAVSSINVYRSGYHPKYGGRVGGTVDVRTKNEVPDSSEFGVGLNTIFASGYANVKLDSAGKVGLLVTGRSFLPVSLGFPKQKAITTLSQHLTRYSVTEVDENVDLLGQHILVNDVNAKLNLEPDTTQNIILSFFKIYNRDIQDYRSSNNHKLRGIVELKNIGSSLRWAKQLGEYNGISVTGVVSDYSFRLFNNRLNQNGLEVLKQDHLVTVQDIHTKLDYKTKVGKRKINTLELGYSYLWQKTIQNLNDKFDPFNSFFSQSLAVGVQNVIFGNYDLLINDQFHANLGVRFVHYNRTNEVGIEPRLNLNYVLNENFSLKSSCGYYQQYLNQLVYFDFNDIRVENHTWDLASDSRPTVNNLQTMFGFTLDKSGWLFDAEFYAKSLRNLQVAAGFPGSPNEYAKGSGKVYGIDVLLRKRWNNFDLWASYTYNYNRWKFAVVSDDEFRPYYDQPHIFNVAGSMNLNKWKFSLGWYWKSGIPNQNVSTGFALGPPGSPQPQPGFTYNGRYKNVHQMDLSALYEFKNSSDWRGYVGLSIQNLYDRVNVIEQGQARFDPGSPFFDQQRLLIGFAPNINLNVYW